MNDIKLVLSFGDVINEEVETVNIKNIINETKNSQQYIIPKRPAARHGGAVVNNHNNNTTNTIKISNLVGDINEDEVREIFEVYGPIRKVNIPRCPRTRIIKGFAFIVFNERMDGINAIKNLHKSKFDSCIIDVDWVR